MGTRRLGTFLIVLLFVLASLPNLAAARPGGAASGAAVDAEIWVQMAAAPDGRTGFFVLFDEQADLSPAYGIGDWQVRGQVVYDALRETAARTQAGARAWLDARGITYRSFAIDNSLFVTADAATLQQLAGLPEVAGFRANRSQPIEAQASLQEQALQAAVPWNIAQIGADRVWQDFGVKGQGIVVAHMDTGVEYTHDALFPNYKCGSGPHGDCWYDPSNTCPSAPCDDVGRGTHLMGVLVGDDNPALAYSAGVAPDAQWIACKACGAGGCSDFDLNACADWLLAPNANPGNRPQVIALTVNSTQGCNGWFLPQLMAWRAAGIFPVVRPGSNGPACYSMGSPGSYEGLLTAGATDPNDLIMSSSSRGPGCGGGIKPEVAAPGVNICSAYPGNTWSCAYSGTSFSTVHTAGLAALLYSADPALIGNAVSTTAAMTSTALCIEDLSCGGTPCPDGANNVYGWGRIDAYAAVEAVLQPDQPEIIVRPEALEALVAPGQIVTRTLWITNNGTAALTFTLSEFTRTRSIASAPRLRPRAEPVVDPTVWALAQARGRVPVVIYLRELADLTSAYAIRDRAARGQQVYELLQATASHNGGQFGAWLQAAGVEPQTLLAANAIAATVDAGLLEEIAGWPEVAQVVLDRVIAALPQDTAAAVETVEWNIAKIGADRVWSRFGITGQGVTVGEIDTGVEYAHAALVSQYRGNLGGGNFDHNYNWYDYTGTYTDAPGDGHGHGTAGIGLAVGDDGGANQIGAAPGAHWIAYKAVDDNGSATLAGLHAAMDWMLAPADLGGANPRPDLRPQVVLNMWQVFADCAEFQPDLLAWRAAGIVPVFPTGSQGPECGLTSNPGSLPEAFTCGATDANDDIIGFSARGPSPCSGEVKPEVTAPGMNVRSAWAGGGYLSLSGTSYASAQLAGAAALVLSADPSLGPDAVERIITTTTACRQDLTCGGNACPGGANNTYGWGRIDVFAAVSLTLREAGYVIPWLAENPLTGTLLPGEGHPVLVTFDAAGLADGVYEAGIAVTSNDPDRPQVGVSVTMTVSSCDAVAGLDFTWTPPTPTVGQVIAFTGTATGTPPITYSWRLDAGSLKEGVVVTHSYSVPGIHTVALTATNCGAATAVVTHTLTVLPLQCDPVHDAAFSYTPLTPAVGEIVVFTGTASGTLPITYTWDLGDGSAVIGPSTFTHTYSLPGTFTVTLNAANPCGQAQVAWPLTVASGELVHLIALLAFDNDLSPYAAEVIERVRMGTAENAEVRVTLLVDQRLDGDSEVVEVAGGVVTHTGSIPWQAGVQEVDSASAEVLAGFLVWARSHYPATSSIVALLGHGVGLAPEAHLTSSPRGIASEVPPLPQFRDRTSGDVTSGTYLSTPELGRALSQASGYGSSPFDLLFLDQCFEGNLEVLYEVRAAARVLVASPNYAWAAFAYDRYVPHFAPTAGPEEIAQTILEEYEAALDAEHPNAIVWVRSGDVAALGDAVSALGDALRGELGSGGRGPILAAALGSRFVDTTLCAADLELCPPDELLGIGSFARGLQARFAEGSPVHTAASLVLQQLANVHGAYRTGHPWVRPEVTWAYTDTLTIVAPLTPTLPVTATWRASIYTATAPLRAVWAPQPTRTVTITVPLAYALDGRWDEFVAAWYGPLTPTVGQLCRALPPALPFSGTESLTLTVEPHLIGAQLEWSPDPRAASYGVYVLRPDGTTWELLEVVPAPQTRYQHVEPLLPAGPYSYRVAARNTRGTVLALSADASAAVGIMAITPTWGYRGVPTRLFIYGLEFFPPLTVTVDGRPVPNVEVISPGLVVAVAPPDVAPGPHCLSVVTPAGQTVFYNGFRVVSPYARIYLPCVTRH